MDGDSFMSNLSSTSSATSNRTANDRAAREKMKPLTVQEETKIDREFNKYRNLRHSPSKGVVIIKWAVTVILGGFLLACVTDSKISILSLSEQMNRKENDESSPQPVIYELFVMLQILVVAPHVLNFLRGVWAGGFRRDIAWPRRRALIVAFVVSVVESAGLCIFVFKIPGLLKPSSVVVLMSCVFFIPIIVNLITAFQLNDEELRRKGSTWKVLFFAALILEVLGIVCTFLLTNISIIDRVWAFTGVLLLSVSWVPKLQQYMLGTNIVVEKEKLRSESYLERNNSLFQATDRTGSTGYQTISEEDPGEDTDEYDEQGSIQLTQIPGQPSTSPTVDNEIRFERQPWKLTIFMSFWKALFTFAFSMVLFMYFLFDNPELADYRAGWTWTNVNSKQTYYFVANLGASIGGYIISYIACTACMQRWAFSLPLFLATPTAVIITAVKSSCNNLFDPAPNSETCNVNGNSIYFLIGAAAFLVFATGVSIGWLLFRSQSIVMQKEGQLFWVPMYNPVLLEQWLMLVRRNEHTDEDFEDPVQKAKRSRIIICTTMYREADFEMRQLLESIQRVNIAQSECDRHFESHVFFDGAVKDRNPTEFVLQLVSLVESTLDVKAERCTKTMTPYGMSLSWKLNAAPDKSGMIFRIHLKDNFKVKNKKRWSQVMYMSYVLDFLMSQMDNATLEETYILTTDADVRFTPDSVEALLDLMTRDRSVGAVCARTHPLGSGPMVWYQVFEYAIGHWFQKAAEHVLGSVLCSPGCFSVYRCKALKDILPVYASNVSHAFDFLTKDMGEDRWLCTLMVQSGWRIEYCAASENRTHCPEEFDEFYKQRRRWVVSTLANLMLLIKEWNIVAKLNHRVSFVFLIYQSILLFATLIGPSSVILVVSGGLTYGWNFDSTTSVVLQVIVCCGFVLACLFTSSKTQLNVAKALTFIYAIIMTATIVGTAVQVVTDYYEEAEDDTATTPATTPEPITKTTEKLLMQGVQKFNTTISSIVTPPSALFKDMQLGDKLISESFPLSTTTFYLALMVGIFAITGLLHLGEVLYLLHGIWYLLFLPSGYLILMIYSICNITDRSWGTREAKTKSVVTGKQSWQQMLMHHFKSFFFLDMFVEQKVFTGPPILAVAPTSFFAASEDSAVPTTGRRASLKDSVSHVGPAVGTDAGSTVYCHNCSRLCARPGHYVVTCCFEQKAETKTMSIQTDAQSHKTRSSSRTASVSEGNENHPQTPDMEHGKALNDSRYSTDGALGVVPEFENRDESDEDEIDEHQIIPVKEWLPRDLKKYADNFTTNGFDNTMLIAGMTEKELKSIGIKGKGAKRYLMEEIKRLPDYDIQADVPENVEAWLQVIGLNQYKSNFVREQIRSSKDMEVLKAFGRTEIEKELKITKAGHVKRLLYAIRKLRNPTESERKIIAVKKSLDSATTYHLKKINVAEFDFWERLKGLCLSPQATAYGLDDDLKVKLGELRNLWLMCFAVSNFLWLILITTLANKGELLSVVNSNPVGLVVLVLFSTVLVIQFFAMLVHRVTTLTHFLGRAPYKVGGTYNTSWAFNDNDILKLKQKNFGNDDFEALIARQSAKKKANARLKEGRPVRNHNHREERQPLLARNGPDLV